MQKDVLKQYLSLKKEIKELEECLSQERNAVDMVHDVVKGSSHEFPWNLQVISIEGMEPSVAKKLHSAYEQDYIDRICKADVMRQEIEDFIDAISDSLTRRVFRKRYIQGQDWLTIAHDCGSNHESYPRKIVDRYLERNSGALGGKNEL